jgi:hypothetical protein
LALPGCRCKRTFLHGRHDGHGKPVQHPLHTGKHILAHCRDQDLGRDPAEISRDDVPF